MASTIEIRDSPLAPIASPHIIGELLNMILFGILVVQTYVYYLAFPKDKPVFKALVYILFLLEAVQTVFMMHDTVRVFAIETGEPTAFIKVHLAWFSVPVLSSLASAIVQCSFSWRIYVLSESLYIPIIVGAGALLQLGAGITQGVQSYIINDFTKLPQLPLGLWLATAAICDIIIAVAMSYYLSRRQTGVQRTDALVTKLIRMTIETGTATACVAILTATLFFAMKTTNYFVTPSYVLGKLYVNNLLMIFNSRMNIVGGRNYNPTPQTNMSGNGRVNAIPLPKHYSPGSTEVGGGGYNAETGLPPMAYGRRPSDTSTLRKTPGEIEAGRQVRVDIQTAVYEDPPSSDFGYGTPNTAGGRYKESYGF